MLYMLVRIIIVQVSVLLLSTHTVIVNLNFLRVSCLLLTECRMPMATRLIKQCHHDAAAKKIQATWRFFATFLTISLYGTR
jgi:hypothetical protein